MSDSKKQARAWLRDHIGLESHRFFEEDVLSLAAALDAAREETTAACVAAAHQQCTVHVEQARAEGERAGREAGLEEAAKLVYYPRHTLRESLAASIRALQRKP